MAYDSGSVPVQDASTVMLLRSARGGGEAFEVYLTRRRADLVFVGGAYVFPGGKVDAEDEEPEALSRCRGLKPERAAALLQMPPASASRAAAFWVAAVRELFEEAGVLLAYRSGGLVDFSDPADASRFAHWRRRLNASETTVGAMLAAEDLRLATDRLHYVSHWITPEGPPRRFSARFFLTLLPPGQEADHHPLEADEGVWMSPRAALQAWTENRLGMIPPTVMNLQRLAEFERLDTVLNAFPRV
jgi:8-oxo-dGTP pyrophosphatase MutT (NUDIX family)